MRRSIALLLALFAIAALAVRMSAAGLTGRVQQGDQPVPGATVIASRADRQIETTTDENGAFTFGDLDNGTWTVRVEMLTFVTLTREIAVPSEAPTVWNLTLRP